MGCEAALRPLVISVVLDGPQGELAVANLRQPDRAVSAGRVYVVTHIAQAFELPLPLVGHRLHVLSWSNSLVLGANASAAVDRRLRAQGLGDIWVLTELPLLDSLQGKEALLGAGYLLGASRVACLVSRTMSAVT